MAGLPKKIAQAVAQIAKQTGEVIAKEPLEILKTAGQQTGLSLGGDKGVEKPQAGGPADQQLTQLKKKQEEEKKKIEFYRQKLREYAEASKQPVAPPIPEEEPSKVMEESGLITPPGEPSKRGTALMGRRKKGKGSGEMVAHKRSK